MNRAQRRAAAFKRNQQWDRNVVNSSTTAALEPILYHRQYTDEQAAEIANMPRMAWHRLTSGEGTEEDFDVVSSVANQVMVRAERIGELAVEVALRGRDALISMKQRYKRLHKFGADAAALQDVPPMLDLYYEILSLSNPQQMILAHREAYERATDGVIAG